MITPNITRPAVAILALFLTFSLHSQDVHEVALTFLKRLGVPCLLITRVDTAGLDTIATCHDGREWALYFVDAEVAFVDPQTREPYRWSREVYMTHPEVYGAPTRTSPADVLGDDGP